MSKIRMRFERIGDVKFISHLDTMRLFDRVFRRANVNLSCTQGFNKHSKMSFACPMPVGLSSVDEYIDIELDEEAKDINLPDMVERINKNMVEGMKITKTQILEDTKKSIMSLISAASYIIILKNISDTTLKEKLDSALKQDTLSVTKKTKKGESIVNVKDLIFKVDYKLLDSSDDIQIDLICAAGSVNNLNAELFLEALNTNINLYDLIEDFTIQRTGLYTGEYPELKKPIED